MQEEIMEYYDMGNGRIRLNQKICRFFRARYQEYLSFLITVFPSDIMAVMTKGVISSRTERISIANSSTRSKEKEKRSNTKHIKKVITYNRSVNKMLLNTLIYYVVTGYNKKKEKRKRRKL